MRTVALVPFLFLLLACSEDFRPVPHTELVRDLRSGRVEELHVCPLGGEKAYRYLRLGRDEPERIESVSPAGVDAAGQVAEAEGIRVLEDGALCD